MMPSVVMLTAVMLSAIMLNVVNAECHNDVLHCVDCRYPKPHYGKRRDAKFASAVSSGRKMFLELSVRATTSTTTTPKPEVATNYRQEEKKILVTMPPNFFLHC
jgi:hypothetical protein